MLAPWGGGSELILNMRWSLSFLFCLITSILLAQKYDRNWIFGTNSGICFSDSIPATFKVNCNNVELSATFSDSIGNLLFFFDSEGQLYAKIKDSSSNEISQSINAHRSESSGPIIIPTQNDSVFVVIHTGRDLQASNCPNSWCLKLYFTILQTQEDSLIVIKKNQLLLDKFVYEHLAAVKHGNSKDWWVFVHTEEDSTNRFYKFLITDTVINYMSYQDIGTFTGLQIDFAGQMQFSKEGNQLALVKSDSRKCEIYNFDRCTGQLLNFRWIILSNLTETYGLEFSSNGKYLYVTSGWQSFNDSKLVQIDLSEPILTSFIIATSTNTFAQLQYAPDNKIYLANQCGPGFPEWDFLPCNQYLSVINHPDSAGLACDFKPFSFYLGDSSKSSLGLPNMPNYNLGALSIYEADADIDTVICTEDTTVKGVLLGVPAVAGVSYSWQPSDSLNYTNIAEPFANPTESTWYYVTLTDTSIKYSCQSRVDSVFVEVKNCSVGINEAAQKQIIIFPNPTSGILQFETTTQDKITQINLHDITGKPLQKFQHSPIDISAYATGAYMISIHFSDGTTVYKKIVKK